MQAPAPALAAVTLILVGLFFVYLFALRPWLTHWGATHLDTIARLPGDSISPRASAQFTNAISSAAPEAIWPWIVQLGQHRAGFYSYTFIENLFGFDIHDTRRIVPEWQHRTVGDTVWIATPKHFNGQARMVVAVAEPLRSLALSTPADWKRRQANDDGLDGTWEFALLPKPGGTTRLLTRWRMAAYPNTWKRIINFIFLEPAHCIMQRKMLLTIKQLAERGF